VDARPPPSTPSGCGERLRFTAFFFKMVEKEGWQP